MRKLDRDLLKKTIEETVRTDIQAGRVGGVAVAVMQEGRTVYEDCFGNEELGICVKEDTVFRMASMTKPITAVAVLILVDRGLIQLDCEVSEFIPEFAQMQIGQIKDGKAVSVTPAKTAITIRHLLSHGSGVGSGPVGDYVRTAILPKERTSLKKVVDYYAQNPLDFEPGSRQYYSGIHGYDTLARVVEVVADMPFAEFLQKEIFEPLGMADTTFAPTEEQWSRMIPLHSYTNERASIVYFPEGTIFGGIPTSCCCGGAGLASTLSDYKKFADMLLHNGKGNGKQIISEALVKEMATPQLPKTRLGDTSLWGLGVRIVSTESYGDLPVGSFGWSGACGTHFWVDPENQIVGVYLKNSMYDGGSGAKTARQFEKDVARALI